MTWDHLRRGVDKTMIFAALAALWWPALHATRAGPDANLLTLVLGVSTVLFFGIGVVLLAGRWPLVGYVPVAAAVLTAGFQLGRGQSLSAGLSWLVVGAAAIGLIRQALRTRADGPARQRATLARRAFRDPLTGLGNRSLFLERATDALAGSTVTAVILVDLGAFREVNDVYGHATGDGLLRSAAERLKANIRADDTVSLLSGDEFAVLLPRLADDRIADAVAQRILRDLAQPLTIGHTVLTVTANAGIGVASGDAMDVDTLLRAAALALGQAKAEGRGVAHRFDLARSPLPTRRADAGR